MALLASPPFTSTVSPDDVLKMNGLFELVDDQLVEKQMSSVSGETAGIVASILVPFIRANRLGKLFVETSFRCFPNKPRQLRRPDLAFIALAKVSLVPDEGHIPVAPDLAIEIVSPGDSIYEMDDKLIDYRAAGIPLIWIFNPHARTVKIHRPAQPIVELAEEDTLRGEAALAGFSIVVREMFPPLVTAV